MPGQWAPAINRRFRFPPRVAPGPHAAAHHPKPHARGLHRAPRPPGRPEVHPTFPRGAAPPLPPASSADPTSPGREHTPTSRSRPHCPTGRLLPGPGLARPGERSARIPGRDLRFPRQPLLSNIPTDQSARALRRRRAARRDGSCSLPAALRRHVTPAAGPCCCGR